MKKVIALDDHPVVLAGLQNLLETAPDVEFCGGFQLVTDALHWLESNPADVLLLDIHLGSEDGIQVCKTLSSRFPQLRIIALSNLEQTAIVRQMLKNGAQGYLLKNAQLHELLAAIHAPGNYLQPALQELLAREALGITPAGRDFVPVLTRREREVLQCIAQGLTTKEIARELFISVDTVETHRGHLFQKMGVKNATSLIKMALGKGLIT